MNGWVRLAAWLLALAVVALPVVAVLGGWLAPERWPIRHMQVTAEYQRVHAEQIRAAVAMHIGRGYFDTDPVELRATLAQLPWVQQAEVRKRWPDRLDILIVEHRPRAQWGKDRLLSDEGELFSLPRDQMLHGLPLFEGPDDRTADLVAFHERASQQLAPLGLGVAGVRLSARGSWSLSLTDGARIVVGRSATPEARLARLVRVLPKVLASEARPFRRIDLRYTNGFAIAWGEQVAQGSGVARPVADALATAFTNHQSRITNHGFST